MVTTQHIYIHIDFCQNYITECFNSEPEKSHAIFFKDNLSNKRHIGPEDDIRKQSFKLNICSEWVPMYAIYTCYPCIVQLGSF